MELRGFADDVHACEIVCTALRCEYQPPKVISGDDHLMWQSLMGPSINIALRRVHILGGGTPPASFSVFFSVESFVKRSEDRVTPSMHAFASSAPRTLGIRQLEGANALPGARTTAITDYSRTRIDRLGHHASCTERAKMVVIAVITLVARRSRAPFLFVMPPCVDARSPSSFLDALSRISLHFVSLEHARRFQGCRCIFRRGAARHSG